jgi:hypothetical protein
MPIKRFQKQRERALFAKVGTIRKGAKKTSANKPGDDLTYFRYVPVEGEEALATTFYDTFGKEPREVDIFLPFDEIDRVWDEWQEAHVSSGLSHRCDGETTHLWRDENGVMQHAPKPCPGGCKPSGTLRVIIPAFRRLVGVDVLTTSIWDIIEIGNNLRSIKALAGKLTGIPLVLKRRPRMISTPRKNGKRARSKKWLLSIEADPDWVEQALLDIRTGAKTNGEPLEIPAGTGDIDEVTGEIVEDEWDEGAFEAGEDNPTSDNIPLFPERYGEFVKLVQQHTSLSGAGAVATAIKECGVKNSLVVQNGQCNFNQCDIWAELTEKYPR